MEKISISRQHNFDRLNFSTYGLPYDWKSITHYGYKAFRKLDYIGYTIESKVCYSQHNTGSGSGSNITKTYNFFLLLTYHPLVSTWDVRHSIRFGMVVVPDKIYVTWYGYIGARTCLCVKGIIKINPLLFIHSLNCLRLGR